MKYKNALKENRNDKKIFEKIVNIWDPLGVFGLAPIGKYNDIVDKIYILLISHTKENEIKKYLLSRYDDEKSENKAKINELYELICLFEND